MYYDPEKFGLKIFGMVEEEELSYEFNMFVVWENLETHQLYYDHDSGCSCPSPFEESTLENVNRITKSNVGEFETSINEWNRGYDNKSRTNPLEVAELVKKVKDHLDAS